MEHYSIGSDHLRATFKTQGAELCQLRTGAGLDLLWSGDPAVWPRTAPTLFPVVGALLEDQFQHEGKTYPMGKHGFARDKAWTLVRLTGHSCVLRLRDDAQTRSQYPFPFSLSLLASIDGGTLKVQYDLHNPGEEILLASLGAHPAFRWPLLPGLAKEAHILEFEKAESDTLGAVDRAGLLSPLPQLSPLEGRHLRLRDELFARDALIFQTVRSRVLRYSAPGGPTLEMSWDGFPQLGIWSKPGAEFLCLEPWRGGPSPSSFRGEFRDKPGVFQVGAGATVSASYSVRLRPAEGSPA